MASMMLKLIVADRRLRYLYLNGKTAERWIHYLSRLVPSYVKSHDPNIKALSLAFRPLLSRLFVSTCSTLH